jgi:hypothetical protein
MLKANFQRNPVETYGSLTSGGTPALGVGTESYPSPHRSHVPDAPAALTEKGTTRTVRGIWAKNRIHPKASCLCPAATDYRYCTACWSHTDGIVRHPFLSGLKPGASWERFL